MRRISATVTPSLVEAIVPVVTVSESNQREHWAARNRRRKMQQATVKLWLGRALRRPPFGAPYLVTISRFYQPDLLPGHRGSKPMDRDNCYGAQKHVIDQIAKLLKVDDGDETKVSWLVAQEPGAEPGIVVRIEPRTRERIEAEAVRLCGVRTKGDRNG